MKIQNALRIRGVKAFWNGKTAIITFYFDGEISDSDIEIASDACAEIISHFYEGFLEESYIRLDAPAPLPEGPF